MSANCVRLLVPLYKAPSIHFFTYNRSHKPGHKWVFATFVSTPVKHQYACFMFRKTKHLIFSWYVFLVASTGNIAESSN